MKKNRSDKINIPGYEPVGNMAKSPSYGVWLRALQIRMTRHAIIKLLPDSDDKHSRRKVELHGTLWRWVAREAGEMSGSAARSGRCRSGREG